MRDSTSQVHVETAIADDVSTAHWSTPDASHCALPGPMDDHEEMCEVVSILSSPLPSSLAVDSPEWLFLPSRRAVCQGRSFPPVVEQFARSTGGGSRGGCSPLSISAVEKWLVRLWLIVHATTDRRDLGGEDPAGAGQNPHPLSRRQRRAKRRMAQGGGWTRALASSGGRAAARLPIGSSTRETSGASVILSTRAFPLSNRSEFHYRYTPIRPDYLFPFRPPKHTLKHTVW